MINYKKCTDVEMEKVYYAFKAGYSDYIIKMEISQEGFVKRFFGAEGNSLEHSFIAFEGAEPIGLILGGIKLYEGIKTIRCGTLCITPEYRGKGVSMELFKLHKQTALDNGCRQMFLEVIATNDRAVKFYSNLGYEKIYDIRYYSLSDTASLQNKYNTSVDVKNIGYKNVLELSKNIHDIHINWQSDLDYIEKLDDIAYYGVYENSELIGVLGLNALGKIFFIWTSPKHRSRGIASSLIVKAVNDLEIKRLTIGFASNWKLESFLKHMKFDKDKISQYEMYLVL